MTESTPYFQHPEVDISEEILEAPGGAFNDLLLVIDTEIRSFRMNQGAISSDERIVKSLEIDERKVELESASDSTLRLSIYEDDQATWQYESRLGLLVGIEADTERVVDDTDEGIYELQGFLYVVYRINAPTFSNIAGEK